MHLLLLFLLGVSFSESTKTRVLENSFVKVELSRRERPEAEPVSKPYEAVVSLECKKNHQKLKIFLAVCDLDINDKDTTLEDIHLHLAHFSWDGVKSNNNPDGINYCDKKNKIFEDMNFTQTCGPAKNKK